MGTALGAAAPFLAAFQTFTRENSPCHCPGGLNRALVRRGRKQILKSQGLGQEGPIQSIYCSRQGGPCCGTCDRVFCAPEILGALRIKMNTANSSPGHPGWVEILGYAPHMAC